MSVIKKGVCETIFVIVLIITGYTLGQTSARVPSSILTMKGTTLYVGGSGPGNYTRIQDAIDNASDGNTIFVYDESSPYYEHIEINKTITLLGENRETVLIDSYGEDDVIYIDADEVTISGFSIQNSENHDEHYGIEIHSAKNTILGNILLDNYIGIFIDDAGQNTIEGNIFLNNENGLAVHADKNRVCDNKFFNDGMSVSSFENCIFNNTINYKPLIYLEDQRNVLIDSPVGQIILVNCENITITGRHITNTRNAIQLSYCTHCLIHHNEISLCHAGIHLSGSNNNTLLSNTFSSNTEYGIRLYSSHRNLIENNYCLENRYGSYWCLGISLYCSSNNSIQRNVLLKNGVGIGCSYACDNLLHQNYIDSNYYHGIKLEYSSENTVISGNKLRDNKRGITCQDISYTSITNNTFDSNDCDVLLDIIQFYTFNVRMLPEIDGNYWDRERYLPKCIPGTLTFVYMDVPYGGYVCLRCVYRDWHPASEPIDIP